MSKPTILNAEERFAQARDHAAMTLARRLVVQRARAAVRNRSTAANDDVEGAA